MAPAPAVAAMHSSALLQQVVRPVSCALITHLRGLASAAATSSAAPTSSSTQQQRRFLRTRSWAPFGSGRSSSRPMESGNGNNSVADAVASKPSSPRHPEAVMASAFNSPKRAGLSSMPDPGPALTLPLPLGPLSAPPRGKPALPPAAAAAAAADAAVDAGLCGTGSPPPPLDLLTAGSATDLVQLGALRTDLKKEGVVLDPNTPRSPKHQKAEQEMTTGKAGQVLKTHMDAVVKVFATHSKPNFTLPWQRQQQYTSKSTGFAVKTEDGQRWLLTNAHSVSYGTQVQLKKRGDDEKYPAKVLAVGTECDVALLTVEDEMFWKDIVPLELGDLPDLQESVAVLGYPIGGDSLAVSAGVVSRVQMTHYSHGCMSLLAVQTDAAINSGNSGGPVMNTQGQCVGLAFQSLTGDTQSVGYVIPTSVVRHFLSDFQRHGKYNGFPSLNIVWQEMDSKALKRAYGMQPHQKGVLVRSVAAASHEATALHPEDILLRIDGEEVGNDGTVPFRGRGERVDFKYIITGKHVGDTVRLDILRKGEETSLEIVLTPYAYLVPPHLREAKPSYFIVGGLVFTSCSDPYLVQRYGSLGGAPVRLMARTYYGVKSRPDEQCVVLSTVLACDSTRGYESTLGIRDSVVTSFNGRKIHSLAQLALLVSENRDEYLRFDLETAGKVVVMDAESARKSTAGVMEEHNIATEMSRDVKDQLEAWAAEAAAEGKQGENAGKAGAAATPADPAANGMERVPVVATPEKAH